MKNLILLLSMISIACAAQANSTTQEEINQRANEKLNDITSKQPEMSDDENWGCSLLLCLAGNWGNISQCQEPVKKAFRAWTHLPDPQFVPGCSSGGSSFGGDRPTYDYKQCPADHPNDLGRKITIAGPSARLCENPANQICVEYDTWSPVPQTQAGKRMVCKKDIVEVSEMENSITMIYNIGTAEDPNMTTKIIYFDAP